MYPTNWEVTQKCIPHTGLESTDLRKVMIIAHQITLYRRYSKTDMTTYLTFNIFVCFLTDVSVMWEVFSNSIARLLKLLPSIDITGLVFDKILMIIRGQANLKTSSEAL